MMDLFLPASVQNLEERQGIICMTRHLVHIASIDKYTLDIIREQILIDLHIRPIRRTDTQVSKRHSSLDK